MVNNTGNTESHAEKKKHQNHHSTDRLQQNDSRVQASIAVTISVKPVRRYTLFHKYTCILARCTQIKVVFSLQACQGIRYVDIPGGAYPRLPFGHSYRCMCRKYRLDSYDAVCTET